VKPQYTDESLSKVKALSFALVIAESNGLLTSILGVEQVLSRWVFAAAMVLFCGLAFFIMLKKKAACEIKSFYYPILAFVTFFLVSFISANFLFPKPLNEWLPSLYVFTTIFIFYFLYIFKYNSKEVVWGLITVSIAVSLLLLVDHVHRLPFLDHYQRRSAFFLNDVRRIVLLKNEVIFGFIAVVSIIISGKKEIFSNKLLLAIATMLFFVQALIMESRMGFMAMGIACITLMYLKGITKKTLILSFTAILVIIVAFPIIFSKHIDGLSQMKMNDSTSNISIRFETIEHFYKLYLQTNGLGIGMMSATSTSNNVLHREGNYNLLDAGAFSALFQFGLLGVYIWLLFTVKSLQTYNWYYKYTANNDPYSAAAFAFIMGFTISLLPLSFFTASWCIGMGGVLLYLMWFFRMSLLNSDSKVNP
jgi:hypothetical protein